MTVAITPKLYIGLPALDTELVLNPGFETLDAGAAIWENWTDTNCVDEAVIVHGGAHACKLLKAAGSSTTVVSDAMAVTDRHFYRLTFWTRGDGTHSPTYAIYDWTNFQAIATGLCGVPGAVYEQVTVDFATPIGCVSLHVSFGGSHFADGGAAYIDDVSLMDLNDYDYTELVDALPYLTWGHGLPGSGPLDLVAQTGILLAALDNGYSNSTGTPGLYSPGHADCLAGFELGAPVYLTLNAGAGAEMVFYGWIARIVPTSGLLDEAVTEIEVHDFMGYLSGTVMPPIAAAEDQRVDQALTTLMALIYKQPYAGLDFDTGEQVLPVVFDTDEEGDSVMSFFQKMAQHEQGRIYMTLDGELHFESRYERALNSTVAFTLTDATRPAALLSVEHDRAGTWNRVEVVVYPLTVGAYSSLNDQDGIYSFGPNETKTLTIKYKDALGKAIGAVGVENPVTDYEFGTIANFISDDCHASLTQANTVGGTWFKAVLTNSLGQRLYLNDFSVWGFPVTRGDGIICLAEDATDVAVNGPRQVRLKLEQIANEDVGRSFAAYLLLMASGDEPRSIAVAFNAEHDATIAAAALAANVSQRFTLTESLTGLDGDYFIDNLQFTFGGQRLLVQMQATRASLTDGWPGLYDAGHFDDPDDGRYGI